MAPRRGEGVSAFLRVYFALAFLAAPTLVPSQSAVHDWRPVITAPSEWDWLPQAAHLPNLGVHKLASRGK